jgi:hypothetical protein
MDADTNQEQSNKKRETYFLELLRDRIVSLENGSSPFTKKELFLDICEYASSAYAGYDIPSDPEEGLEDEDIILENASAGLLLGFLLRCLNRYGSVIKNSNLSNATAIREELAKAFCLTQVDAKGHPMRGAPLSRTDERASQYFEDGRFLAEMRGCNAEECCLEGLNHAFIRVYGRAFEALSYQHKQMAKLREWCLTRPV